MNYGLALQVIFYNSYIIKFITIYNKGQEKLKFKQNYRHCTNFNPKLRPNYYLKTWLYSDSSFEFTCMKEGKLSPKL